VVKEKYGIFETQTITSIRLQRMVVVVVLPDPFRGMGAWTNSTETQQSSHAPRSGPEIKNGRSSAKDGAPERLRCKTIQEEVRQILQRVSAGAARRTLHFILHR